MLQALGDDGAQLDPGLHQRLTTLPDAHALWYARMDLVAVRSEIDGEAKALATVQELLPMFEGLLPSSMTAPSRFSR
jgi:hypothetical protein